MFALRTFARAAPLRASSRLATASTKLARSSLQSNLRNTNLLSISRTASAAFSTSRVRLDEHSQHLAAKLEAEIRLEDEETSAGSGSNTGVKQFFDEVPDWEVIDTEGEQDVFLQKKYDGEEVTVHFSISDFNVPQEEQIEDDILPDEEDMEMQSGGAITKGSTVQGRTSGGNLKVAPEDQIEEDLLDEDEQQASFPVSVTVLIRRPDAAGKGNLRFDLLAENGDFMIQQLVHLPETSSSAIEQIRESYSDRSSQYSGPPFEQLDEEVQGMLEDYLGARGITSHLASVIPDYVDVKEQKEYLAWLKRVKSFVE